MLSQGKFISGMTLLQKNYIGWQFDLKDEIQVKLWYSAFKNLTDEQFSKLIKEYISKNEYPPKCIKNLTDIYVERQIKSARIPPEKALDVVKGIISDSGGWDYDGRTEIYTRLASYPLSLRETVKEFESSLKTMPANDPYTADRFRKAYEERLWVSATNEVNNYLGLSIPDNSKLLGSGFLPSEV